MNNTDKAHLFICLYNCSSSLDSEGFTVLSACWKWSGPTLTACRFSVRAHNAAYKIALKKLLLL